MGEAPKDIDPRSLDLAVGGQAVIEGVMMRCPTAIATAVRTPGGKIVIQCKAYRGFAVRAKLHRVALLRGAVNLVESMALGMRALTFSAEQALEEEDVGDRQTSLKDKLLLGLTLVFAFALSLALFFYLPLLLTEWTGANSGFMFNVVDGFFRLAVFLAYILLISRLKDMRTLFQYHGAEHKTIHTFENGLELTAENAQGFTTLHPRCGTSFLMFVMLTSIFVFMLLGKPDTIGDRLLRLSFVPLIGGIAYEIIRFSGKHAGAKWIQPFIWPGLMLQRITTQEPTLEQLEVAVRALRAVLEASAAEAAERHYREIVDGALPA
ncbi:MAG TPA: DUF1385 domain-containing protein [Candidatus Krumholzibacteria bacterium]